MADKKDIEKNLNYARGYRDALVDTWDDVLKMATKGYSPQEIQIVAKTKSNDAKRKIELKIAELEADFAQDDIIEIDDTPELERAKVKGVTEAEPILEVQIAPRTSYLVKEPKPIRCYEMMAREKKKGRPVLIICRTPARDVRDKYDLGKSLILWLTMNEKASERLPVAALGVDSSGHDIGHENDEYVKPGELPKLYSLALNFVDGHEDGLILFEGLEYLTTHNSFQSLMNFLQKLNEYVIHKGFTMIVSVNPATYEPKQLSMLEGEMSKVLQ